MKTTLIPIIAILGCLMLIVTAGAVQAVPLVFEDAVTDRYITSEDRIVQFLLTLGVDVSKLDSERETYLDLYTFFSQLDIEDLRDLQKEDIREIIRFPRDDTITPVPEPGTLVLLGIGMLGVAAYRRKMN